MSALRIAALMFALAASACGETAETPTSASPTAATTVLFSGTLQPRATRFYSYSLTSAGSVTAMLASLERNGVPVGNALELGLGIPAGTGCAVSVVSQTTTSLIPQLRQEASIGTYCVRVADVDGLPGPLAFTIRVIHP
jgi:hypothetical protein